MKILPCFLLLFFVVTVQAAPKKCKGEDGKTYSKGKGYTDGCTTYTCTKMGKKMKMVKKVSPNCCQYKDGMYQPGQEIETMALGECSQKLIKCGTSSIGVEVQTVVVHGNCCLFNGEILHVGDRIAHQEKCEWVVCGQVRNDTSQEVVPTLQIDMAHDSCHCCLGEDGNMYKDGDISQMASGETGICCKGHWADAINVTSIETLDLVVTGGNNFGPTCFANSSLLHQRSVCSPNIPDLPHDDMNGAKSVWFNNKLWNCGGYGHAECYTYTPGEESWEFNSNMTMSRYAFTLTVISEDMMIATGGGPYYQITDTMEIYSIERGTWEQTTFNMTQKRYRHCALYYNNFLVVIAGLVETFNGHHGTGSVEKLDLSTGTWTQLTPLPEALYEHACSLMQEQGEMVMYVSGGVGEDKTTVYKYVGNSWIVAGHMKRTRHGHTMEVGMMGRLVVVGGVYHCNTTTWNSCYHTSIEMMNKEGQWNELENGLEYARYAHTMAPVPLHTFHCV